MADDKIKLAKIHRSLIRAILNNENAEFDKVLADNKTLDVSFQSSGKCTPLHTAAAQGRRDMCEKLVNLKANIEAKNAMGFTPLVSAAINGHESVVATLLKAGSDKNVTTVKGETAATLANQRGFSNVASLLK